MKKKFSIAVLFLSIFCSCRDVTTLAKGVYTIDEISYKGRDIKQEIGANMILLKRHNKCTLPITIFSDLNVTDNTGKWEITRTSLGTFQLSIESRNKIFAGVHTICFEKDFEQKVIKLQIRSGDLNVVCSKGFVNFDKEASSFDEFLCSDLAAKEASVSDYS